MRYAIEIPDFRPAGLNELLKAGPYGANRLKKRDKEYVWGYGLLAGVTPARGKRRVSLRFRLGPRQRKYDRDNCWKSILDALVAAKFLVDDSERWLEQGDVDYDPARGIPMTTIEIEDIEVCDGR